MNTNEIRRRFLGYFSDRGHEAVASASGAPGTKAEGGSSGISNMPASLAASVAAADSMAPASPVTAMQGSRVATSMAAAGRSGAASPVEAEGGEDFLGAKDAASVDASGGGSDDEET